MKYAPRLHIIRADPHIEASVLFHSGGLGWQGYVTKHGTNFCHEIGTLGHSHSYPHLLDGIFTERRSNGPFTETQSSQQFSLPECRNGTHIATRSIIESQINRLHELIDI